MTAALVECTMNAINVARGSGGKVRNGMGIMNELVVSAACLKTTWEATELLA